MSSDHALEAADAEHAAAGGRGGPERPQLAGRRAGRRAGRLVVAAVAVVGLASGVLAVSAWLGGYRLLLVASGSMAPTLAVGDVLVTHPVPVRALKPGQVVTFTDTSRGGLLVTHRVAAVDVQGARVAVETRGDANTGTERWTVNADDVVGGLVAHVGGVGPVVGWLMTPMGRSLAAAPVILIGLALLRRIWARPPPGSEEKRSRGEVAGTSRVPPRGAGAKASVLLWAGLVGLAGFWMAVTVSAFTSTVTNSSSLTAAPAFPPDRPDRVLGSGRPDLPDLEHRSRRHGLPGPVAQERHRVLDNSGLDRRWNVHHDRRA